MICHCVIINLSYRIHLEFSMWQDLEKESFLKTYLKSAKTEQ